MAKNIRKFKEALYSKLTADTGSGSFVSMVGDRFYAASAPVQSERFPRVSYQIIGDRDYANNDSTGQVTTTELDFIIEDNKTTTGMSDDIESRIKVVIGGEGTLTTSHIVCYTCIRRGVLSQRYVPEVELWVTIATYVVTWAPKS